MARSAQNPTGLLGVDFVEYTGSSKEFYSTLFQRWGFKKTAEMADGHLELYQQNQINFIVNTHPQMEAQKFGQLHGPSISATGFVFENATEAYHEALSRGARAYEATDANKKVLPFPAIYGIGDSLVYFLDEKSLKELYQTRFGVPGRFSNNKGAGFHRIDHFTNNVPVGEMQKWCDFYTKVFNFRETRFFDIRGQKTGLISKVMRSPCSTFAIPINEPTDQKSQIQEYLNEYKGSGIQHLALITENIIGSLQTIKGSNIEFLTPPPKTYYKALRDRVPNVKEDLEIIESNAVLVDGDHDGYLLQIFSKNIIGPIFFEVIQRRGHEGFGEGNFQALFDAIERDQKERGYL